MNAGSITSATSRRAPVQQRAFHRQLELARGVGKPVFLHQRDAHEDFVAILREHGAQLVGGVAHCFTGTAARARGYLGAGLAIGITGWICDERRGAHLLPLMRADSRGRLLLETDGPYLLPRDLQPKPASRRNEPAYLAAYRSRRWRRRAVSRSRTLARRARAAPRGAFRPSIDFDSRYKI